MKSPEAASQEPMDDVDFEILDGIRELYAQADPMPADLPEQIKFTLAMRHLEAEAARIVGEDEPRLAAVRGEEQSRTVTFDSDSLTIMIRIDENKDGTVRIDGWLAPPLPREIELQTMTDPQRVASDGQGRFAFTRVPHGTARLVVSAPGEDRGGPGRPVVTPRLVLLPAGQCRTRPRAWPIPRPPSRVRQLGPSARSAEPGRRTSEVSGPGLPAGRRWGPGSCGRGCSCLAGKTRRASCAPPTSRSRPGC